MPKTVRTFVRGRMNKEVDERLVPEGEYINALNARFNSTEGDEVGSLENAKGNEKLTTLSYNDTALSSSAVCLGALEDGTNERIFWFVHDPAFSVGGTGKLDLIVSYNTQTNSLLYHIVSINSGNNSTTTLNFDPQYPINAVDLVDDLLFFTDNLNPPRVVNIDRSYSLPQSNIDNSYLEESILVIKKPPIKAPEIELIESGDDTYIEDRLLCFAYRYRYEDGEYSATSPFSLPAFEPNPFDFSPDSFLNEGMKNKFNAAVVSFDTGSPLVTGVDLLFKEADSDVIKVIKRIDKQEEGFANDVTETFTFSSSKIFTILPNSEILRLYDNVPLLAKAQTFIGNRLMYGNYVEGYDLDDTRLTYSVDLNSEVIGEFGLGATEVGNTYTVNGSLSVGGSTVVLDLTDARLEAGDVVSIDFTLAGGTFNGTTTNVNQETGDTSLSFAFVLPRDYASVYALVSSDEFLSAFGTEVNGIGNFQPVSNACEGTTFTDQFNCAIPNDLSGFPKFESFAPIRNGSSTNKQHITPYLSNSSGVAASSQGEKYISFVLPTMRFGDSGGQNFYEYYTISSSSAVYQEGVSSGSLHSNRNYEVGIVYMDDFGRSTTALVSDDNAIYIPCSKSGMRNEIVVNIPPSQKAPTWASHYKFVIKADREGYETIYSSIFFNDPDDTSFTYFLIDGQNSTKVEEGDELTVKADSGGVRLDCVTATVLEKKAQEENFLGEETPSPAGVYMKIKTNDFGTTASSKVSDFGKGQASTRRADDPILRSGNEYPYLQYPLFKDAGTAVEIPQSSRVKSVSDSREKGLVKAKEIVRGGYMISKKHIRHQQTTPILKSGLMEIIYLNILTTGMQR